MCLQFLTGILQGYKKLPSLEEAPGNLHLLSPFLFFSLEYQVLLLKSLGPRLVNTIFTLCRKPLHLHPEMLPPVLQASKAHSPGSPILQSRTSSLPGHPDASRHDAEVHQDLPALTRHHSALIQIHQGVFGSSENCLGWVHHSSTRKKEMISK